MSISQKPLRSDSGFSSPGFVVDTSGNINITGIFKVNGVPVLGGSALPSTIVTSNLTTLGTLVALTVDGVISVTGNGASSTINNVVIGNDTPLAATFTTLTVTDNLTINPTTIGAIDNVNIGNNIQGTGKFTAVTITQPPSLATDATTKSYVDNTTTALKLNATALAIALGS